MSSNKCHAVLDRFLRLLSATRVVLLILVAFESASAMTRNEGPHEPNSPPTVFLDGGWLSLDPQRRDSQGEEGTAGETLRQAILLAARDELGCVTRDYWLGESIDADDRAWRLNVVRDSSVLQGIRITLRRCDREGKVMLAKSETVSERVGNSRTLNVDQFTSRLERLELASRGEIVSLLKALGIDGKPNVWRDRAPVPEDIVELLREPAFTGQFRAVRRLHRLIRDEGESPERLAALVEGYLHLSYLTDCYMHPAHEIFKIRAVLYAHRLTAKRKPTDGYGRGIRFAALVLAGFHQDACGMWQSRLNRNPAQPDWIDLAEPCLEYDAKSLAALEGQDRFGPWARLYAFRIHQYANDVPEAERICSGLLEEYPTHHAIRGVPLFGPTVYYLERQDSAARHLGERLYGELARIPNLPEDVTLIVEEGSRAAAKDEQAVRERLMEALTDPNGCGSARNDPNEMSWQVLGCLIRELSFSQVLWRAFYLRYAGPSPSVTAASQWINDTGALTRKHRFRPFLDSYGNEGQRGRAIERIPNDREALEALLYRVRMSHFPMWLFATEFPQGDAIWYVIRGRGASRRRSGNNIGGAFLETVCSSVLNQPPYPGAHGKEPMACSPYNPSVLYSETKAGSVDARAMVETYWSRYDRHPEVKAALGIAMHEAGEHAEATQRLESVRAAYPAYELYNALAHAYLALDDADEFYRTIDEYRGLPTAGETEKVVLQLKAALELLAARDRAAAFERLASISDVDTPEGRAARSLMLELEGRFDEAFELLAESRHQWDGPFLDWYWAAVRAGVENIEERERMLDFNRLQCQALARRSLDYAGLAANYLIATASTNLPASSRQVDPRQSFKIEEPLAGILQMHQFLQLPVDQYESAGRGRLAALERPKQRRGMHPTRRRLAALAGAFARGLEDGTAGDLNADQMEDLFAEANLKERGHLLYFVGAYYARAGDEARAMEYWKRAVPLPLIRNDGRNMCIHELRRRGITDQEYHALTESWFDGAR